MKGHTCLWNMPGTSPPGREGLSGPGEASWPPISTSQRFKNGPEASSWHTFPIPPPCPKPYASEILVTHHFSDPLGFLQPGGLSTLEVPPSTCSFILLHLGWFHPPICQSPHQMLYLPGSLLCTTIQRSSLLHEVTLAPRLSASHRLWPHSFNKNLLCSAQPVLCWYPETRQWGTEVCVCMLGAGGCRVGWCWTHGHTNKCICKLR